jgi:hypothetical protein
MLSINPKLRWGAGGVNPVVEIEAWKNLGKQIFIE